MKDERKTKKQLIDELNEFRQQVKDLESGDRGDRALNKAGKDPAQAFWCAFDDIRDGLIELDKIGTIVAVNKSAVDIFGGTREELVGKHFTKIGIFSAKDIPQLISNFKQIINEGRTDINLVIRNKVGREIPLECSASVRKSGGKTVGTVVVVRDVSERKGAEKLLDIQRELTSALSAVGDLNEGLQLCVEATLKVSGMDCGGVYIVDAVSGAIDMVYHQGLPADFVRSAKHFDADTPSTRLIMKGKPVYSCHQELGVPLDEVRRRESLRAIAVMPISHQNEIVACLNIASHVFSEVPGLARLALEDIAAQIGSAISRLRAENAWRKSEDNLKAAQRLAHIGNWYWDVKTNYAEWSDELYEIYGRDAKDGVPPIDSWLDYVHPDDRAPLQQAIQDALEGKGQYRIEYRIRRYDDYYPRPSNATARTGIGRQRG